MKLLQKAGIFFSLLLIISCKNAPLQKAEIDGERIPVDTSIKADTSISNFIEPYKEHLNKTLDSTISYNPVNLSKDSDNLNSALGNLMADMVMEQANPIFKKRTGHEIDMVLLNHGGIRSNINRGDVTSRTAYALMPFENEIVIAELSGKKVKEMLKYLEKAKTAHPMSGAKITLDKNYRLVNASINGKEIDTSKTYFIATSDYLQQGGDNMNFFKDPVNLYGADYKLRNAIIDYFTKTDTIKAEEDDRFIRQE